MFTIRSFRHRLFLAHLGLALVPVLVILVLGTMTLSEIVVFSGTAGPWASVAESGQALVESAGDAAAGDPELASALDKHREALSRSVRLSGTFAFVADLFLERLPVIALLLGLLIGLLAFLTAKWMSRGFSQPIQELVEWTGRIGRSEPLPPLEADDSAPVREFEDLRSSLHSMAAQLEEGRRREIENTRLRSWTEMARSVAHELKNPLTPMRLAATEISRAGDPRLAGAAEVLLEEIDGLNEMARSFAQFGRMPEGPPSEVDLRELLEHLVEQFAESPVRVAVAPSPPPPLIEGHHDSLLRVFRNLLANAVEASMESMEDGEAMVRLHLAAIDGGAEVRIRDSGPGIAPEALDSIWEVNFTTKTRGSGLGLPLVRRTVEAHGGRVEVRSSPGEGAEFRVFLPAGLSRDPATESSDSS